MKSSGGEQARFCTIQNIATLAHLIWLSEGRPHGEELQCWMEAEVILNQAERRRMADLKDSSDRSDNYMENGAFAAVA